MLKIVLLFAFISLIASIISAAPMETTTLGSTMANDSMMNKDMMMTTMSPETTNMPMMETTTSTDDYEDSIDDDEANPLGKALDELEARRRKKHADETIGTPGVTYEDEVMSTTSSSEEHRASSSAHSSSEEGMMTTTMMDMMTTEKPMMPMVFNDVAGTVTKKNYDAMSEQCRAFVTTSMSKSKA